MGKTWSVMNWFNKFRPKLLPRSNQNSIRTVPEKIGFIVGTGRCGTTILSQILNNHSHIVTPPELQFITILNQRDLETLRAPDIIDLIEEHCPYHLEQYFDYKAYLASLNYPQRDLKLFYDGFFGAICSHFGKNVFLEQTPWHGQHLHNLRKIFPHMYVIHLVRDPRDVVFSFQRTPYWGEITFKTGLLRWEKEVQAIRKFGMSMGQRFIEVKYEDMVQFPEDGLARILALLGLQIEPSLWEADNLINYRLYQKEAGVALKFQSRGYLNWFHTRRDKIFFSEGVYAWRNNPEYLKYQEDIEIITETMKLYGYEA